MFEKQVYDLNENDLIDHPVWYFPMDDTAQDELSIRPVEENFDFSTSDYQFIVRTEFSSVDDEKFIGYLYWSFPAEIEYIKPVVFVGFDKCVTFWNGISKPSWDDYGGASGDLRKKFPFSFNSYSHETLYSLSGFLEGLYFLEGKKVGVIK